MSLAISALQLFFIVLTMDGPVAVGVCGNLGFKCGCHPAQTFYHSVQTIDISREREIIKLALKIKSTTGKKQCFDFSPEVCVGDTNH